MPPITLSNIPTSQIDVIKDNNSHIEHTEPRHIGCNLHYHPLRSSTMSSGSRSRFKTKSWTLLIKFTSIASLLLVISIAQDIDCLETATDFGENVHVNNETAQSRQDSDHFAPLDQMISTKQPRQHFRLNLSPSISQPASSLSSSPGQLNLIRIHRRRSAKLTESNERPSDNQTISQPQSTSNSKSKSKKITNSTLKKLLNQYNSNNNNNNQTSSGPKSSNFKFVFIQRATAAPSTNESYHTKKKYFENSPNPPTQSLAASVSKQLASSLLQSAANLIGNATSTALAPSLSQLAARVAAATSSASSTSTTSAIVATSPQPTVSNYNADLNLLDNDIKRLSSVKATSDPIKSISSSVRSKKKHPSKIYNLPVKFVSNGQPNGQVVLHSFKQHFATIRKIQSMSKGQPGKSSNNRQRTKDSLANKLKGSNSRLIYLPLKYLSNARPNVITSISSSSSRGKSTSLFLSPSHKSAD